MRFYDLMTPVGSDQGVGLSVASCDTSFIRQARVLHYNRPRGGDGDLLLDFGREESLFCTGIKGGDVC